MTLYCNFIYPGSCVFIRQVVLALAVSLLLPGLAGAETGSVMRNDRPLVVTSIRPLYLIVHELVDAQVDTRLLLDRESSAHDFALRPSQLRLLRDARQVFWIDASLEHPLPSLLARLPGARRDTALLPLLALAPRADGVVDPHVWLDPRLASELSRHIAQVLVDRGLVRQADLQLERFVASMQDAEARMNEVLADVRDEPLAAMHDGYAYLVRRFGLRPPIVLALDAEQQVGARSLSRMRRDLLEHGARCLLVEHTGGSPRLARTIAQGAGIPLVEVDLLAADISPGEGAFARFLVGIARHIASCRRPAVQDEETR